ncbi:MAG: hypothetical protein BRC35_03685 [Cyanobacteria bacterium QH_10_48_56]|nr:MAG: hypothetical protein BRC35_03685 [Cyanobacteria bacterium QH_10_48_56]
MDNAIFYQGEMVREFLEKNGPKLIYLLPYSAEFFPIENFGYKLKAIMKKLKPRTYKDLIDGITEAMLEVTDSDIRNCLLTAATVPRSFENCYKSALRKVAHHNN